VKNKNVRHRLFILRRIVPGKIYRLMGPLNIIIQPEQVFCTKAGYHEARNIETFDDWANTDLWQLDVYKSANSNDSEFKEYVSKWFVVNEQIITNDKNVSQILFCTKKDKSLS
jgi:hypothetical protein